MQGQLRKLSSKFDTNLTYSLVLGEAFVPLNDLIGKEISLEYSGQIFCVACGKVTRKSFNQGYCYPCFTRLAQCDLCIVKPELCHYHLGTCREPEWGEAFCFQPHIVYLANSSGLKVGITRLNQIPTRWIDQGVLQALALIETRSRHMAGLIEVAFGKHMSDKTSWQKMLKNQTENIDLYQEREQVLQLCNDDLAQLHEKYGANSFRLLSELVVDLIYPVQRYPTKVNSLSFDKTPEIKGLLEGIKGQYLLFEHGVLNIRKFSGYEVKFSLPG